MRFLHRIFRELRYARVFTKIEYVTDAPQSLNSRTVYVLGDPVPWSLFFVCPCGCRSTIELNLIDDIRPRWVFENRCLRGVSIYPSIWLTQDCKSHFSVRSGRVYWHKDIIVNSSDCPE